MMKEESIHTYWTSNKSGPLHWTRHSAVVAVEANPRRVPTHSPPTSHSCCPEASSARQQRTSNTDDDISIASAAYALHWASLKEGCIFLGARFK